VFVRSIFFFSDEVFEPSDNSHPSYMHDMHQAGSYNTHYSGGAAAAGAAGAGYYSSNESSYPNPYYVQDPFANNGYQQDGNHRLSAHSQSTGPGFAGVGAGFSDGGYPGQGYGETQGGIPYESDRGHGAAPGANAYGGMDVDDARDPQ
jgi:hypothetical protein